MLFESPILQNSQKYVQLCNAKKRRCFQTRNEFGGKNEMAFIKEKELESAIVSSSS